MKLLYSHMKKHSPPSKLNRNKPLRLPGIVTWPRDSMRHTHYKALVTRKESEEFFALWEKAR